MIHVLAFISVKPGSRDEFLEILKRNVPNVLAEDGCGGYEPMVDVETDLEMQSCDENVVTMIEKWESIEHLKAHLETPHMKAFFEQTADMRTGLTLKILQPA